MYIFTLVHYSNFFLNPTNPLRMLHKVGIRFHEHYSYGMRKMKGEREKKIKKIIHYDSGKNAFCTVRSHSLQK